LRTPAPATENGWGVLPLVLIIFSQKLSLLKGTPEAGKLVRGFLLRCIEEILGNFFGIVGGIGLKIFFAKILFYCSKGMFVSGIPFFVAFVQTPSKFLIFERRFVVAYYTGLFGVYLLFFALV
jgi:hypothetical protein